MVSHEFRNPLKIISGTAQILEKYDASLTKAKKQKLFAQLKHNTARMTDLLEDVNGFGIGDRQRLC